VYDPEFDYRLFSYHRPSLIASFKKQEKEEEKEKKEATRKLVTPLKTNSRRVKRRKVKESG